jgi:hypothetical protein
MLLLLLLIVVLLVLIVVASVKPGKAALIYSLPVWHFGTHTRRYLRAISQVVLLSLPTYEDLCLPCFY